MKAPSSLCDVTYSDNDEMKLDRNLIAIVLIICQILGIHFVMDLFFDNFLLSVSKCLIFSFDKLVV